MAAKQIPNVGRGARTVIVARFPDGTWSYGGSANDPCYEHAELYRVHYDSHFEGIYGYTVTLIKRKAQQYRSRQLKKAREQS